MGRLGGGVECSIISWTRSEDESVPTGVSLVFTDTGFAPPAEVCVLCAGEDAEEGATTALMEEEAWN